MATATAEKKESFRRYLEVSGAIDAITKSLVSLYEDENPPETAVDYIREQLGGTSEADVAAMKARRDLDGARGPGWGRRAKAAA